MADPKTCPDCGAPIVDKHQDEVDIGVGVMYGPAYFLCENGHVISPNESIVAESGFKE
jgi:hypothetical protein